VGLERGPLSLVSTNEEIIEIKNSGSGLENRDYNRTEFVTLTMWHPLSAKVGTNFADKWQSLSPSNSVVIVCNKYEFPKLYIVTVTRRWYSYAQHPCQQAPLSC
jgi:hypothetical protein